MVRQDASDSAVADCVRCPCAAAVLSQQCLHAVRRQRDGDQHHPRGRAQHRQRLRRTGRGWRARCPDGDRRIFVGRSLRTMLGFPFWIALPTAMLGITACDGAHLLAFPRCGLKGPILRSRRLGSRSRSASSSPAPTSSVRRSGSRISRHLYIFLWQVDSLRRSSLLLLRRDAGSSCLGSISRSAFSLLLSDIGRAVQVDPRRSAGRRRKRTSTCRNTKSSLS